MEKELSLFNKVGDLYLKTGKVQAAVETYERAANYYEESGLPNNAIALCNKILRNAPGRTPVYLKLAKLMVQRGFVAEAKQNLLEYASRMQQAGQLEDAFNALKEFADLSPDNEDIRLLLAEQLKAAARTDEAKEQLAKLYHELEAKGDQRRSRATLEKIQVIDPDFDADAAPKPEVKERARRGDLVFLDLSEEGPEAPAAVAEPEAPAPEVEQEAPAEEALELEPTSLGEEAPPEAAAEVQEPIELERGSADYLAVAEEVGEVDALDELDMPEAEVGEVEAVAGLDVATEFEAPAEEAAASLDIEPTAVADAEAMAAEVPPIEGLAETAEPPADVLERTSEGFVPPEAIIAPPDQDVAPAAVEEAEPEAAERTSEGFVPPDAIIEPPDETAAAVEVAPEAPPQAEPEFPEVSPPATPVPVVEAEAAPPGAGMDVPDIDLGVGLDDEETAVAEAGAEAAPSDMAKTPLPSPPDVGPPDVGAAPSSSVPRLHRRSRWCTSAPRWPCWKTRSPRIRTTPRCIRPLGKPCWRRAIASAASRSWTSRWRSTSWARTGVTPRAWPRRSCDSIPTACGTIRSWSSSRSAAVTRIGWRRRTWVWPTRCSERAPPSARGPCTSACWSTTPPAIGLGSGSKRWSPRWRRPLLSRRLPLPRPRHRRLRRLRLATSWISAPCCSTRSRRCAIRACA
jgi:tetratricopeptide (TPR) repeat protein